MTEGPFLDRAPRFLQELEWNALEPLKKRLMNLQQQQQQQEQSSTGEGGPTDTSLPAKCAQILKAIEFLQTTFVVDLKMQILEAQEETPTDQAVRTLPDPQAIVQELQAILPASTMRLNVFSPGWQDRSPSTPPPIDPELLNVAKVFLQQLQSAQKPLKHQIHQLQTKQTVRADNPKKVAKLVRESAKILKAIQLLQQHETTLLLQIDDANESGIPFDMPPLGEIQQRVAAILSQKSSAAATT